VTHIHGWTGIAAAALAFLATTSSPSRADNPNDAISQSQVQQGLAASPIPASQLNFTGKNPYLVALGSYLVNSAADCNGCHTFPRFLRPGGTAPGTNHVGNATGNLANLGSDPRYGNPYLDPVPPPSGPDQSLTGQLKANTNADITHGTVAYTPTGVPINQYNHFLAGGRCFGFFMSRNLTPDDSGKPRGLTEAEFMQVMRQGKDVSCDPNRPNPPTYGGVVDPVCSTPEGRGAGVSFNPGVLQTMSWPTYHSMTDTDLKAIYAYLSALPQSKACNTVQNGCAGFFGDANTPGSVVGQNSYAYANTDDCPKNGNNSSPPQ
jgi:hypothetical protein